MAVISQEAKTILEDARVVAKGRGSRDADPGDILTAAALKISGVRGVLEAHGVNVEKLEKRSAESSRGKFALRPVGFTEEAKGVLMACVAKNQDVSGTDLAVAAIQAGGYPLADELRECGLTVSTDTLMNALNA